MTWINKKIVLGILYLTKTIRTWNIVAVKLTCVRWKQIQYLTTESIELFIEGEAFLRLYEMASAPPPPPPHQ